MNNIIRRVVNGIKIVSISLPLLLSGCKDKDQGYGDRVNLITEVVRYEEGKNAERDLLLKSGSNYII